MRRRQELQNEERNRQRQFIVRRQLSCEMQEEGETLPSVAATGRPTVTEETNTTDAVSTVILMPPTKVTTCQKQLHTGESMKGSVNKA